MAVRIAGVSIPDNKKINIALTYVFGIGRSRAEEILEKVKVDKEKRTKELSDDDVNKLRQAIEKEYIVEGDLRREVGANIKRLKEIGSYRGERHTKGLPMRGQKTKVNARTSRRRRGR
jgi:small subunit ribosomal protein S13